MLSIILTEFQKIKRYHILLIGIIGMTLSPILGIITQNVAIEEAQIPNFDMNALIDSTIWNNATLFMPIIFTLIGGYLINREYTDHTLKNILVVPISFNKLLTGKLVAIGLMTSMLGCYSYIITIIVGLSEKLSFIDNVSLIKGLFQMIGLSICIYITVSPIIALCGKIQGFFIGSSIITFILGYCSMFFKTGLLRNIYPFLASFTVIGFDTTTYINAKDKASLLLGILSLSIMLVATILIIALSKKPSEMKTKRKKKNLYLRSAQHKN